MPLDREGGCLKTPPDGIRPLTGAQAAPDHRQSQRPESMSGSGYLKFRNDRGVPEICIGVREFECIGVSPPQDYPHIYINMGEADTILCPYCGTQFRFDPRLTPSMRTRRTVSLLTITQPEQSRGHGTGRSPPASALLSAIWG